MIAMSQQPLPDENSPISISVDRENAYQTVSVVALSDSRLSSRAVGVYYRLYALNLQPKGIEDLASMMMEGRDAIRRVVHELEDCGYLHRTPTQAEDGSYTGWNWKVNAIPKEPNPAMGRRPKAPRAKDPRSPLEKHGLSLSTALLTSSRAADSQQGFSMFPISSFSTTGLLVADKEEEGTNSTTVNPQSGSTTQLVISDPPLAKTPQPKKEDPLAATVEAVLADWREVTGRRRTIRPTDRSWRKIRDRLEDGFTPAELRLAFRGALADPFMNGTDRARNASGTWYCFPETVLRDSATTERHITSARTLLQPEPWWPPLMPEFRAERGLGATNGSGGVPLPPPTPSERVREAFRRAEEQWARTLAPLAETTKGTIWYSLQSKGAQGVLEEWGIYRAKEAGLDIDLMDDPRWMWKDRLANKCGIFAGIDFDPDSYEAETD